MAKCQRVSQASCHIRTLSHTRNPYGTLINWVTCSPCPYLRRGRGRERNWRGRAKTWARVRVRVGTDTAQIAQHTCTPAHRPALLSTVGCGQAYRKKVNETALSVCRVNSSLQSFWSQVPWVTVALLFRYSVLGWVSPAHITSAPIPQVQSFLSQASNSCELSPSKT